MPLNHYLPANFLANFSAHAKVNRRRSTIAVGDKMRNKHFVTTVGKAGAVHNLYRLVNLPRNPDFIEKVWTYEQSLQPAIADLVSGHISALTWAKVLVPFVTGLLVRGPDFATRFESRIASLGFDDSMISDDNTNLARLMEFQRLLASVAVSKWVVLRTPGNEPLLTNDLGYVPMLSAPNQMTGLGIPLGMQSIAAVLPRSRGIIAIGTEGRWYPAVEYGNLHNETADLNRAIALHSRRFIFGAERSQVCRYLTREISPSIEPGQIGFLDGHQAMLHEYSWHHLVAALQVPPTVERNLIFLDLMSAP